MPWPDIFGRRHLRNEIEQLSEAVKHLQDTTKASASELFEAVKHLQNTTETTANELSEAATALRDTRPDIPSRKHSNIAVIICVLAIVAGSVITTISLDAFRDPTPVRDGKELSTANLILPFEIGDATLSQTNENTFVTYQQVPNSFGYQSLAVYDFILPEQFAGRKFRLLLTGSAVMMDNPYGTISEKKPPACYAQGVTGFPQYGPCQVIEGVLGSPIETSWNVEVGSAGCTPAPGGYPLRGVPLRVSGYVDATIGLDWAHRQVNIPAFGFDPTFGYAPHVQEPFSTWRGMDLGGQFKQATMRTCKAAQILVGDTVTYKTGTPKENPGDRFVWEDEEEVFNEQILITRTRANGIFGNGLLALGTAVIAIGIGFIPLVFQWKMAGHANGINGQRGHQGR